MPSIEDFDAYVAKLSHHDWYYDYSDDGRVWRAGKRVRESLMETADSHPIYFQAFDVWRAYVGSSIPRKAVDIMIQAIRDQLVVPA